MADFTVQQFIGNAVDVGSACPDVFTLECGSRAIRIDCARGPVKIKKGTMMSYTGVVSFEKVGVREQGFNKLMKQGFTSEGLDLATATGNGVLFVADMCKNITLLRLQEGEKIIVNGSDVLAFEDSVQWDVKFLKKTGAMVAGGLANVALTGPGFVAVACHGSPLTFKVTPQQPVSTDPQATVLWSSNLEPKLKVAFDMKKFYRGSSGDSLQMTFEIEEGEGFVVVQPYEENPFQQPPPQ